MFKIMLLALLLSVSLFSKNLMNAKILICTDGYHILSLKDVRVAIKVWLESFEKDLITDNVASGTSLEFESDAQMAMQKYLSSDQVLSLGIHSSFFINNLDKFPLRDIGLIVPVFETGEKIDYTILVHKDSNIESLKDLKSKKVALEHQMILGELFLDKELLQSVDKRTKDYIQKLTYTQSGMEAILKTYFKKQDAAVVQSSTYDLAVEMNPSLLKDLKVIKKSKKIFLPVLFIYNKNLYNRGFEKLIEFNSKEEGKNILKIFKLNKIVFNELNILDQLIEYNNQYKKLLKKYEAKKTGKL